jgi:8-oxo-dGTP diphosphatase
MKAVSVAKALVVDDGGRMLALRRSGTHPMFAGQLDLPGGMIELGEEPGQALARELDEETGLSVKPEDFKLLFAGSEAYKEESFTRLLYLLRLDKSRPDIKISWEHDQFSWVPLSELGKIETKFFTFYSNALHYIKENNLLVN